MNSIVRDTSLWEDLLELALQESGGKNIVTEETAGSKVDHCLTCSKTCMEAADLG